MQQKIIELLQTIKNKQVSKVRFLDVLDTCFLFELGALTKVDLENKEYEGEYTVMVNGSWRIINQQNKILVTSRLFYQDKKRVFGYMKMMNKQIVSHIEIGETLNLFVYFTTGHCLEIFADDLECSWWIKKEEEVCRLNEMGEMILEPH